MAWRSPQFKFYKTALEVYGPEVPKLAELRACTLMRSLLRSTTTRLYFEFDDKWVADIARAHDFGSSARAIQFAVENRFKDVEVVLAYEDSHYDIAIPLSTKPGKPRSQE